jgi:putative ABC transport system permease protein
VPLITEPTIFTILQPEWMPDYVLRPVVLFVVVVIAKLGLDWFFSSQLGLAMRATGANPRMARAQGVPPAARRWPAWRCPMRWSHWPARCSRRRKAAPTSRWASAPS